MRLFAKLAPLVCFLFTAVSEDPLNGDRRREEDRGSTWLIPFVSFSLPHRGQKQN